MSTHNNHFKYRTPKRNPTIISTVPPGVALIVSFRSSNYRCLEQIFMVPKGFEPSKFDCTYMMYRTKTVSYQPAYKRLLIQTFFSNYSKTSVARTPMARLPWIIQTRF